MTSWRDRSLYDRIYDRWSERDDDYTKANNNRDMMTTYYRSDEIVRTDEHGMLVGEEIYNGSGPWYARIMATGFQGSLVSKNIPWIRYQMEQMELKGIDALDQWMQDIKEHMSDVYQRSNFYDIQPQFTLDGVTTGSPVIFGEENEDGILWTPQHFSTVRVFYDKFNRPEGVIVKDERWTAKQIVDTFIGKDPDDRKRKEKLPLSINMAIDTGRLNDIFTVYKATFKITDPIWTGSESQPFEKPVGTWKWLTVYMAELQGTDAQKKNMPLNENMGDFSQPFAVWNFDKKPWEVTSRTPAFYALWDTLGLQQIDKNYLENVQYLNRPTMMALESMAGRLQLGPEGEILVSEAEYGMPPVPLQRVGDIQWNKDLMELKEGALKRWFYADMFQMFSELAREKNQPVTAQQIWRMAGEKSTLLSPAIETHSRYLESTDARMIDLEVRAGRGPFDADTLANITDIVLANVKRPLSEIGIRPVFIGQLAQAQKISQSLEPIQSTIAAIAPLMEIYPDLPHLMFREYDIVDDICLALDFPQKNIIPKEEYEERKAALQEARAQAERQAMMLETAKVAPGLGKAVEQGSVLAGMAG